MNKKLVTFVTVLSVAVLGGATFAYTNDNTAPAQPVTVSETADNDSHEHDSHEHENDDERKTIEAGSQAGDTQTDIVDDGYTATTASVSLSTPAAAVASTVAVNDQPVVAAPAPVVEQPAAPVQPQTPAQPEVPAEPVEDEDETVSSITIAAGKYSDVYTAAAINAEGQSITAYWVNYSEAPVLWGVETNKNLVLDVQILSDRIGTSVDFRVGALRNAQPGEYEVIFALVDQAHFNGYDFVIIPVTVTAPTDGTDEVVLPVFVPQK